MSLELKKKQVELLRVQVAKQELELKIEERLEEINRIKEHIKAQENAEIKIINELKQLKRD